MLACPIPTCRCRGDVASAAEGLARHCGSDGGLDQPRPHFIHQRN